MKFKEVVNPKTILILKYAGKYLKYSCQDADGLSWFKSMIIIDDCVPKVSRCLERT